MVPTFFSLLSSRTLPQKRNGKRAPSWGPINKRLMLKHLRPCPWPRAQHKTREAEVAELGVTPGVKENLTGEGGGGPGLPGGRGGRGGGPRAGPRKNKTIAASAQMERRALQKGDQERWMFKAKAGAPCVCVTYEHHERWIFKAGRGS